MAALVAFGCGSGVQHPRPAPKYELLSASGPAAGPASLYAARDLDTLRALLVASGVTRPGECGVQGSKTCWSNIAVDGMAIFLAAVVNVPCATSQQSNIEEVNGTLTLSIHSAGRCPVGAGAPQPLLSLVRITGSSSDVWLVKLVLVGPSAQADGFSAVLSNGVPPSPREVETNVERAIQSVLNSVPAKPGGLALVRGVGIANASQLPSSCRPDTSDPIAYLVFVADVTSPSTVQLLVSSNGDAIRCSSIP